jgi:hypothetical protein
MKTVLLCLRRLTLKPNPGYRRGFLLLFITFHNMKSLARQNLDEIIELYGDQHCSPREVALMAKLIRVLDAKQEEDEAFERLMKAV